MKGVKGLDVVTVCEEGWQHYKGVQKSVDRLILNHASVLERRTKTFWKDTFFEFLI